MPKLTVTVITRDESANILAALDFAKAYGIKLWLASVSEGWMVAKEIAELANLGCEVAGQDSKQHRGVRGLQIVEQLREIGRMELGKNLTQLREIALAMIWVESTRLSRICVLTDAFQRWAKRLCPARLITASQPSSPISQAPAIVGSP